LTNLLNHVTYPEYGGAKIPMMLSLLKKDRIYEIFNNITPTPGGSITYSAIHYPFKKTV